MALELSPERWQKLESLFTAAVELAPDERRVLIERETAGDPELARALNGMLAASTGGGARLASIVESAAERLSPKGEWIGRRFGAYRVVREIGRGGMGLVFEAVRDDDTYRKRVALKVAPWWRDSAASRDRFRAERQFLAELEHPNIARLLDGGSEDGTPYFVMEFVEGRPITTWCDDRGLDVRQRLALFRSVCDAVRYAHERLIVHRDLKPGNILVGDDGTPKLLDFGIAKLLDPGSDPSATTGEPAWTPDFASPEQVRGKAVTTRTDVYSLGLVLYEILCGARAQVADTSSPLALDRSVCDITPPLPSVKAAARSLDGDLDTIVMTAIRKEPERRYESAAAFADDIGRYLDGRPILARASTWGYRAGKLLRRHKVAAAAALVVAATIVAGTAATLYQARRAERRFNQVRSLANTFVFDIHDRIQDLPGSTEARKAIVQTALTYLENLSAEAGGDPALARELAAAYERVGTVQGHLLSANLGDPAGAAASYQKAEALLAPLAARGDRDALRQLTTVMRNQAVTVQAKGDHKATLAAFDRTLVLAERLVANDRRDATGLGLVAEISADQSRLAYQTHDLELAERAGRRAMEAARELVALEPDHLAHQDLLATAHNALGSTQIVAGRLEDAAASFRESVALREGLVARDVNNASFKRTLMVSYGNLGDVLGYRTGNLGDFAGARAVLEKAVAIAVSGTEQDKSDIRAQFDVANAKLRLGGVLAEDPATLPDAIVVLGEAERVTSALLASDPKSDRYGYLLFIIRTRLGDALAQAGRGDEAISMLTRVRESAAPYLKGVNASGTRANLVPATITLARLRAERGEAGAVTLADWAETELNAKTLVNEKYVDARAFGNLGRAYLAMASRDRQHSAAMAKKAAANLEKSRALWTEAKVAAGHEPRRAAALSTLQRDLDSAGKLVEEGHPGLDRSVSARKLRPR